MADQRTATITRNTKETRIELNLDLDGSGMSTIETGIPFFDHMLTLFARHGLFDLRLKAEGDIEVDYHHTVEDVGLVLGQAVRAAVGEKRGMARYGFFLLPMDETLARVVIDLSNRPFLVYQVDFPLETPMVRDFNIHLMKEFFQAFANEAGCNLHCSVEYGSEPHHVAEGLIKAFARALDRATAIDPRLGESVWTTKGSL
jgi:imidazoleglycerol-phosphate dehydratase